MQIKISSYEDATIVCVAGDFTSACDIEFFRKTMHDNSRSRNFVVNFQAAQSVSSQACDELARIVRTRRSLMFSNLSDHHKRGLLSAGIGENLLCETDKEARSKLIRQGGGINFVRNPRRLFLI